MTHWHESNPWAEDVVYVPAAELAEAVAGGFVRNGVTGMDFPRSAERLLEQWSAYGKNLDAYILPSEDGMHSPGIRYGKRGGDYLSLSPYDSGKVAALLEKYRQNPSRGVAP